MDFRQAIDIRRSRRRYLTTPIHPGAVTKLRELIADYSQKEKLHIELVLNNGKAFNSLMKSYGMFSGVNHYIGLIADKNDPASFERLGYYGEYLTLAAVSMGLGSCWVGGTFDRSSCPFSLSDNESIAGTIVLGNTREHDSIKERLIHNLTHRKTKSMEEMYTSDGPVPDWFTEGMRAVQKAPSSINRQPVAFLYRDGKVTASVKNISDAAIAMDFGIAKLHFEIGSGGGKWNWGNNAEFFYGQQG